MKSEKKLKKAQRSLSGNMDVLSRMKQNPDEESRNMAMWVKSNLNYMSPDSFNLLNTSMLPESGCVTPCLAVSFGSALESKT